MRRRILDSKPKSLPWFRIGWQPYVSTHPVWKSPGWTERPPYGNLSSFSPESWSSLSLLLIYSLSWGFLFFPSSRFLWSSSTHQCSVNQTPSYSPVLQILFPYLCCLINRRLSQFPFWGHPCFICLGLQLMTSSPFSRYHGLLHSSWQPLQSILLSGPFCHRKKLFRFDFLPFPCSQSPSTGSLPRALDAAALFHQPCMVLKLCESASPVLLIPRLLCHAAQCMLLLGGCFISRMKDPGDPVNDSSKAVFEKFFHPADLHVI